MEDRERSRDIEDGPNATMKDETSYVSAPEQFTLLTELSVTHMMRMCIPCPITSCI